VGASSSRRAKVRELATFLRELAADEIETGAHYLAGEMPQGRLGIGYSTLRSASESTTPADGPADAQPRRTGEIPHSPELAEIDRRLAELAAIGGPGSATARQNALQDLFSRISPQERSFLIALITGELRQGALAGVMVDAIATAAGVPATSVRRAAMYAKSLGVLARVALLGGETALARFQLELMSPITPMLAQTAADVAEALEQFREDAEFEWKMDGARIQLHKSGDEVRIYTRTLNDVTAALPEIVAVARGLPAVELILDGEAIAFGASGRPLPFQTTMRRFGRKLNVEALRAELPMRAFFFDCLHLDGRSLADGPLRARIEALVQATSEDMQIPRLVTASPAEAQAFYEAALAAGHEGVMAKALSSVYEAGNRGASWLKIKRAHTLDLVVLAAEWGHGRRKGWLSNLHLGARDPATNRYVMLGKTFKGLTDAMLEWQTRELLAREERRDDWTVYVRPELVAEIAFSDLQASPRYAGGLALRLARVKSYRTDKTAADADTLDTVKKVFAAQG
jgi:DNA ligase-1